MGAGASTVADLPEQLDAEAAKRYAGAQFDAAAFQKMAVNGKVSREVFLQAAGSMLLKAAASSSSVASHQEEEAPEVGTGTGLLAMQWAESLAETRLVVDDDIPSSEPVVSMLGNATVKSAGHGELFRTLKEAMAGSPELASYQVLKSIGRGSYGTVYLVRDARDDQFYCMKQILLQVGSASATASARASAELEVETLRKLDHPSVVGYHDHFFLPDSLCLAMQYCEGGDLHHQIRARAATQTHFPESQILEWFVQLAMALHYVHSQRILHRDLKSQNVFISHNVVKLGDFGIVKVLDGSITSAQTVIGTPYYLSPEVCQSEKYSYGSDVWALGCILHEMCALQMAWSGSNLLAVVYKITQEQPSPVPESYSAEVQQLISAMLAKDPRQRATLPQVLATPLIRRHLHIVAGDEPEASSAARSSALAGGGQSRDAAPPPPAFGNGINHTPLSPVYERGESRMRQSGGAGGTFSGATFAAAADEQPAGAREQPAGAREQPPAAARGGDEQPFSPMTPGEALRRRKQEAADRRAAELRDFANAPPPVRPAGRATGLAPPVDGLQVPFAAAAADSSDAVLQQAHQQAATRTVETELKRQGSLKQEWQAAMRDAEITHDEPIMPTAAVPFVPPEAAPLPAYGAPPPAFSDAQVVPARSGRQDVAQAMRARCEAALGEDFGPVYEVMKKGFAEGIPPAKVQKQLEAMLSPAKVGKCMLVEELVFVELTAA